MNTTTRATIAAAAVALTAVMAASGAGPAHAAYTEPTDYEQAVHSCMLEHGQYAKVRQVDVVGADGTVTTSYVCVPLRITLYG